DKDQTATGTAQQGTGYSDERARDVGSSAVGKVRHRTDKALIHGGHGGWPFRRPVGDARSDFCAMIRACVVVVVTGGGMAMTKLIMAEVPSAGGVGTNGQPAGDWLRGYQSVLPLEGNGQPTILLTMGRVAAAVGQQL